MADTRQMAKKPEQKETLKDYTELPEEEVEENNAST